MTAPGEPGGKLGQLSREERARLYEKLRQKKAAAPAAGATDEPPLVPVPRDPAGLPLSFSQERLWLLDRLTPGTAVYNLPLAVRLRGPFDPAVLARCFTEVRRRHEILRTTFALRGDEPVQVIHPPAPFPLPCADLAGLPEAARHAEELRLAEAWSTAPFDLERGPLLRALLLRLAPEEHDVLLGQHHIVTDGWSRNVMMREIAVLYEAFAAGRPSPLPELPVQYGDVAVWQRERLRGPVLQEHLAWWRERLAGAPESLELPLDRTRPAVQSFRAEPLRTVLPFDLLARLHELARSERASLFMLLLAGLDLLLHRWSGQEDILVGTPIAGRTRPELDGMIGFFLNSLTLRVDLSGRPTGRELLGRAREAALGAFDHQEIPFEKLLADLKVERDLSRTPLFQVFLNLLNFPERHIELPGGLVLELLADDWFDAKFDLTFYAVESTEGLLLLQVGNADLFEPARLEEMQRQMRSVLEQLVAAPEAPIDAFSLRTPEAAALLPDPAAPLGEAWYGGVHELFAERALRDPQRAAVSDAEAVWTYGELADAAARLAAALRAGGVRPGDPVAIWAHRSASLVWAVMGTLWAGGAFVILDPAYPEERLAKMIRLARPRFWLEVGEPSPPAPLPPHQPPSPGEGSPHPTPSPASFPLSRGGGEGGRERGPGGEGLPRLTLPGGGPAGAKSLLATLPPPIPPSRTAPDDLALIAFTSGSTGTPKGILGRHGPLSHFLPFQQERFGLGEGDRYSLLSGLSHDPLQRDIFTPLCLGGTVCAPSPEDLSVPGRLAGWMARQGITVAHLTPAMAQLLTEAGEGGAIPTLRWVLLVGDILTRLDVDRLRRIAPGVTCVNLYGSTETQRAVAYHVVEEREIADERAPQVLPLGRGMRDVQLLVTTRSEAPQPAGVGEVGEIWVRSPHLARGYLEDEALTADRFRINPFTGTPGDRVYRTGDLGRYRADGEVTFAGRADQQVKIRGFRIEPGEIEAALGRLPGVREAVVLARETPGVPGDRRLTAYLTGEGIDPAVLRDALRARLPAYMVPADFVFLDRLPVTPNAKVDRRALAKIAPEGTGTPEAAFAEPQTAVERRLAEIWRELLGRELVGRNDSFFDLGGHSLAAMRLLTRVRAAFGVELPLRLLFERPALQEVARAIGDAGGAVAAPEAALSPEPGGPAPLSFAQERLWLLDRIAPGTAAYNMAGGIRLRGALDVEALGRCVTAIVCRQASLRTVFAIEEGQPVQIVQPPRPVPLPRIDLSGLPEPVRDAESRRLAAEEAARPFDLAAGPLFRTLLLRLGSSEHVALYTMHHIVSDGWSMGVLFQEIAALYQGFPLAELPLQYADFARRQRETLGEAALERGLAAWRHRLEGVPPLELPADRPRPAVRSWRGGTVAFTWDAGLAAGLAELARASQGRIRRGTLFMALLGLFQAFLHRLSGQDDLAVGSAIANRLDSRVEGLIGFFVNSLVMRTDLSGDPTVREVVRRASETALEAFLLQHVPFERVVEAVQPERHPSRSPLFQVMLNLLNTPMEATELPGLVLEPLPASTGTAKFDLTLGIGERPEGLVATLEHDLDLFDPATAARWTRHLTTLVRAAVEDPERRISELPLLTPDERVEIVFAWNHTEVPYPRDRPLHRLVEEQADRNPAAVALAPEVTYGDLDTAANRLAHRLRRMGAGPEVPVVVLAERSPSLVTTLLAVAKSGGFFVPLDPAHPQERLAVLIAAVGARLAVTEERFRALLPPEVDAVRLDRDDCAAEPADRVDGGAAADNLAYVMFTSGSTGEPKGVAVTHRNVARLVRGTSFAGFGPGETFLQFAPVSFDASTLEIWGPLANGGRLAVAPPGTPTLDELAAFLVSEQVTQLWLTAGLFHQLAEERLDAFAPLRRLLAGGDVLSPSHVRRVLAAHPWLVLVNGYGPTEGTTFTTCHEMRSPEEAEATVPIGQPIANTRVHVLDGRMEPAPLGVWGELYAGGDGLARGYFGRPELTAERFVPDPFTAGRRLYRTGDLARRRPDGTLELRGRMDRQVKIRGFRIEPAEIEAALAAAPGVREAAVLVREDAGEKRLVAYVAAEGETDLRRWLSGRLPEPMIPSAFVALPRLPLTPNGKVDRRELAKIAPERSLDGHVPPRTPVEEVIAGLFVEVLGEERTGGKVGAHDHFFELGGHSLAATRLVSRLRAALGVELPLLAVFEEPSVAGLAARAAEALGAPIEDVPLVPVPRDPAGLPLSFSQERLWFLDRLTPGTATYNLPARARLRGPLDPARLERCFTEIRRRHEALRTRFALRAGAPVQLVDPPAPLPLPRVDLTGLPEERRRREAEQWTSLAAAWPFDLERGPLVRALLLRLGAEEHALLLSLHHIITDGWSMTILLRELAALYGGATELPALPVQVADAALWQRRRLSGTALEAQLGYWRERLAGAPAALDLPLDRARPAVQTFEGGAASAVLPADLSGRLRTLARREGATLFMVLLAGLDLLLARWSGQDDVLVGTPVAGRGRPELEELIGFFLNTLVLRVDLSGRPTLRGLLGHAREAALGAYAHQDLPFEKLLEEIPLERDLSRTPLFQVFLNLLNFPDTGARLPDGLVLEPLDGAGTDAKFDLTIYAAEDGDALALRLVYNAGLFDAGRMEELLRQLQGVLAHLADDPDAPIDAVSLLTPEAVALLPDPAAPLGEAWHGAVHALFAERARRHPERPAVTDAEGTWTYGELAEAAARLAARLRADGLAPGDPVAIWAHRSAPVVWAVLGTLWAGGAFVLLDPAYPPARVEETIRLAEPRYWLEVAGERPSPPDPLSHPHSRPPGRGGATAQNPELQGEGVPPLPGGSECGWERGPGGEGLPRLTLPGGGPAGAASLISTFPPPVEPAAVGPDDLALLAFTSGSTGAPKGIEGRHGPLSHFLPFQQERFGLGEGDRYSLLSGLAHDPLQRDIFTPLCLGGTLCAPTFEEIATPGRLAGWMARERITVAHLTPAMAQILTETGGGPAPSIPTLRWVLLVGDVLTRLDVDRLRRIAPGVTCVNLYGSTETQRAVGHHVVEEREITDARAPQVLPLGRGMRDVQLLVVSRTEGPPRLAGIGEVGEIWVRSPHLARGYRNDPMLTADRFRTNPFTLAQNMPGDRVYRTGDLGRYRPDGEVTFAGRADQQVKIRGFRIELGEIEAALGRLPGVREAIVLAREKSPGDRRLVAYVTGEGLATSALRDALRSRLPAYMVPSAFVPLDRLPVTPNGKVDRRALAKIDPEGLDAGLESAYVAPRSGLEERIAAVWCEVLGLERVGVKHNFFDLGGHSLLLVRLHARLQETLGRELSLVDLFNYPSVEALAAHLDRAAEESPAALEQARGRAQRQIDAARRQKELARARRARPGDSGGPADDTE